MDRSSLGLLFLEENGWADAERHFLQGDASSRKYERLIKGDKQALFVDSPAKENGPQEKNSTTYSQTAHIAENILPFMAIDHYLREQGFTAPEIFAADLDKGFMLVEDLGSGVYGEKIALGHDMDMPYQEAINVLTKLISLPSMGTIHIENGISYTVPHFSLEAFLIEAKLLTDWFWKWLGVPLPAQAEQSFQNICGELYALLPANDLVLTLRDYHSPNIIWCANKEGIERAGLIDFQDAVITHPAYDLVSLLQDARTDIPPEVEDEYKSLYMKKRLEVSKNFDEEEFNRAYAILGAQRNTKILGIFARLALRDNKPHYLAHIPRVIAYLERCLDMSGLETMKAWYETYLPVDLREEIKSQLLNYEVGQRAMVLSAGLGKRMAPLSDTCPKPLIKVDDKPLLEYSLDKLSDIGSESVVVNVHYLAEQIETYIQKNWLNKIDGPEVIISDERDELLETGGGIKKALPILGGAPFFVLNSDSIWIEQNTQNLLRLIQAWNDYEMDCLILLANKETSIGYHGKGDFALNKDGTLERRSNAATDFVVSGTYLVHPRLFEDAPNGPFSMNLLWDKALENGRLYGLELDGIWLHIGTPEAVEDAEKYISEKKFSLS